MSDNKQKDNKKEFDLDEKAKDIIKNNPLYMEDEPSTVGSPDNLIENDEKEENENTKDK